MASSNIGVMTTGDIEAQQHNPNWLAAHKHMLRSNQESEVNKSRFFIFKVLQHMRQPSKAFFPMGWKFGLYNRENLDSSGLEAIKLDIARHYGLVGEKWDDFCDAIVDDPKAMLACYDLQDKVSGWSDEQIKHILALDALFLATILDIACSPNELQLWRHNTLISQFHANNVLKSKSFTWIMSMRHDLFRVENQIPRVLIDKVVDYIINFIPSLTFEGIELHIDDLQYRQRCVEFGVRLLVGSFMDISSEAFKSAISSAFGVKTHLFGVAYHVICGPNGSSNVDCTRLSTYIHIPLAAKLDQSSIKIVGVDGPLCTMSYENKCLYLPKVTLASQTSFFLRNMLYYETVINFNHCLLTDYIFLMIDLIQTCEDVNLLIECGVINCLYGFKAFEMWIELREGLWQIPSSKTHNDMKNDIVSRCKHGRYRLWSEFQILFCSRPWLVLSTIAIVLVTMATLVQTYIAIIGSNKMKPKFP